MGNTCYFHKIRQLSIKLLQMKTRSTRLISTSAPLLPIAIIGAITSTGGGCGNSSIPKPINPSEFMTALDHKADSEVSAKFLKPVTSKTSPYLYFSDLAVGARSGNSDTSLGQAPSKNGAIVTIYGRNLSGNVTISVGGAVVKYIYHKGPAKPPYSPANLYMSHRMDMIIFQIPRRSTVGNTFIQVKKNHEVSNGLSFKVKDSGNFYFIKTTGSNNGDGSFNDPYLDVNQVIGLVGPGDIIYLGDGMTITEKSGKYRSIVNLNKHGSEDAPIGMVAYPGATVNIGRRDVGRAIFNWVSGNSDNRANAWVIAKIRFISRACAVKVSDHVRIIGNYFTGPHATGATGMVCQPDAANHVRVYGNEFYNVGATNSRKLYHVVYLKSSRSSSGPRLPTETDKIVGYNYFHDNLANRAINFYSEKAATAFSENNKIHDNYIINQGGDGIFLGNYMTGENWIFNNVVINPGGHLNNWGYTGHSGISLRNAGHDEVTTTVHVYNNTIYGGGWSVRPNNYGSIYFSRSTIKRVNVDMKNNIFYSTGSPYFAGSGASSVPKRAYKNLYFGIPNIPTSDTAAINADPLFVDIAKGNARLRKGSLAIDQGANVVDVQRGILGQPRISGSYDLGAYEQ